MTVDARSVTPDLRTDRPSGLSATACNAANIS